MRKHENKVAFRQQHQFLRQMFCQDDVHLTNRKITYKKQHPMNNIDIPPLLKNLLFYTAIGVFLGFLAPFGMDNFPRLTSISYWVVLCTLGYLIYAPCIILGERILTTPIQSHWLRVALSSTVASALMSIAIPIINWLFFTIPVDITTKFWVIFPNAIILGGVLTGATIVKDHIAKQKKDLENTQSQLAEQQQAAEQVLDKAFEAFIAQLPIEKRGKLLCLEMSDHYLKVHTDKGHHLLLMRFKDALKQLEHYAGIQTHRSWWIAKDAVTSTQKDGRKITVLLENGLKVPVSKTYQDDVRNALLGRN